ncbi:type IV toxin-antitoxin system AbiEi family antitoxin domain-containing protein [Rhodococcus qingshengii]|uniref:type IV toxin-antitoxin system AbiEi family antitoxin domain-containing protein n=1 Tax=Rhodococcus TaxID=1827 RepID=UPI001E51E49C|nr:MULTISPECIES: type IV toxin-antitoxin system AbiEi family antitoxin domain-containing protein [Rhodococcus]MCD2136185.1 type IV toxin-antitoxin system AbiEi family antitoxin domain-containing protein [Rhodococcus qingshengii]
MSSDTRILDLADLSSEQWGLFTMAQAKELGFSAQQVARMAKAGTVERIRHGVYRIGGAPSVPSERLRAAWMMIEPGATTGERLREGSPAVVTHRSAAWLHGLGDVDADVMEFATSKRRQSRLCDVRYRVASYEPDEWTLEDGLPVTTVLMTIVDLASGLLDGGHLAGIVRDAVVTNRVDSESVSEALRPFAHMYGVRLGDGEALLSRFLEEAGIPQSTRALGQRLAGQGVLDLPNSAFMDIPAMQSLRDTMALVNSPAMQSFRDAAALLNSPTMQSVRDSLAMLNSPTMHGFQESMVQLNSPAMQSLRDAAAAVDMPVVEAARKIADRQRRAQ